MKRHVDIIVMPKTLPAGEFAKRRYTVPELMRWARVTRKQLEHWASTDLVKPSFRESKSRGCKPALFYSAADAVKTLIVSDMKRRGFSLQQIRKVADNLSKDGIRLEEPDIYLLTDGHSVYYANSGNEVVDILRHHNQMVLVPIREQVEKLRMVA